MEVGKAEVIILLGLIRNKLDDFYILWLEREYTSDELEMVLALKRLESDFENLLVGCKQ